MKKDMRNFIIVAALLMAALMLISSYMRTIGGILLFTGIIVVEVTRYCENSVTNETKKKFKILRRYSWVAAIVGLGLIMLPTIFSFQWWFFKMLVFSTFAAIFVIVAISCIIYLLVHRRLKDDGEGADQ